MVPVVVTLVCRQRLFEMYRDTAAYEAHLKTPHCKNYKVQTANRVGSLRLVETDPVLLSAK